MYVENPLFLYPKYTAQLLFGIFHFTFWVKEVLKLRYLMHVYVHSWCKENGRTNVIRMELKCEIYAK